MQFLIVIAWIVGAALAVMALPWLVLGVAVIYFKLLRRGTEMAWFDWPFFLAMAVAGGLINMTTFGIVSLVERVTGISLLPPPPNWGPRRPPAGTA